MSSPLLTIVVPTYNRAENLGLLLGALRAELNGLESQVQVLVSDNASTDQTPEITGAMARDWDALTVQRHIINLGPDGNFCSGVHRVTTRYFWIIGDDDCPKSGVIAKILRLLSERQPALVYMQSEWLNPITGPEQGTPVGDLDVEWMEAEIFAKSVHVWVTFISGMVIDKTRLESALGKNKIERFNQTNLVQLGWIFPLLMTGGPFAFIRNKCILATSDNSGGYKLLTVFGVNFTRITRESFGKESVLTRLFIRGNLINHLPNVVWRGRKSAVRKTHESENTWEVLNREIGSYLIYWLLLVPLGRFPRWIMQPVFQSWRVLSYLRRASR